MTSTYTFQKKALKLFFFKRYQHFISFYKGEGGCKVRILWKTMQLKILDNAASQYRHIKL